MRSLAANVVHGLKCRLMLEGSDLSVMCYSQGYHLIPCGISLYNMK